MNDIPAYDEVINDKIQDAVRYILNAYGEDVWGNMHRANAVLLDIAADMPRERILVRSLVEADGLRMLKNAGDTYPVVINRLIQTLTDLFCIEREAAAWVTNMCAAAMGYDVEYNRGMFADGNAALSAASVPGRRGGSLVAMGMAHIVAAASDGTVYSHGNNDHYQTDVKGWRRVTAVAAGVSHTAGLKADGTVLATGLNIHDQCDVGFWNNIESIYAFGHETLGARTDGTVLSAGRSRFNLAHFEDVRHIAKAPVGVYGITGGGKVLFSDLTPDDDTRAELEWLNTLPGVTDIISRASECVALCADGRLYKSSEASGYFSQWRDVVSVADLNDCFAILRADGTVRVLPFNRENPRADTPADLWTDITAVYGSRERLIALTADGRLVTARIEMPAPGRNRRANPSESLIRAREFGEFEFLDEWYL